MQLKRQYSVIDWLEIHNISLSDARLYCEQIATKYAFLENDAQITQPRSSLVLDLELCLANFVYPSLENLIGFEVSSIRDVKLVLYTVGDLEVPYTEWMEHEKIPKIHLVWLSDSESLVCLAHEMAHAAQMLLSENRFMPPIGREICAFLGELALIRYTALQSQELSIELRGVWSRENRNYIYFDTLKLATSVSQAYAAYHYWQNYPFARICTIMMFKNMTPDQSAKLFASGGGVMSLIGLTSYMRRLDQAIVGYEEADNVASTDELNDLCISLSPMALKYIRREEINLDWLRVSADLRCVDTNITRCTTKIPLSSLIKWRSLGILALRALNRKDGNETLAIFVSRCDSLISEPPRELLDSPWSRLVQFDALTALGMALWQLSISDYHRRFSLRYYLSVEILRPLVKQQLLVLVDCEGNPLGLITWAWLTKEARNDIHASGRALRFDEWSGGTLPFINDWVMHPSILRVVVQYVRDEVFPNDVGSSIRRRADGSIRRINRWIGKNRKG